MMQRKVHGQIARTHLCEVGYVNEHYFRNMQVIQSTKQIAIKSIVDVMLIENCLNAAGIMHLIHTVSNFSTCYSSIRQKTDKMASCFLKTG